MNDSDLNKKASALMRARLDGQQTVRANQLLALDNEYYPTDRDDELDMELRLIEAHISNGRLKEGYAVAVTGPTGAGKTTLVTRRLNAMSAFKPFDDGYGNEVQFVLRVVTPSSCTAKLLLQAILLASGYPLERTPSEPDLKALVKNRLRRCMHKIIFFDEFQHVLKGPKAKGAAHLTNTIKELTQDPDWPLWLVVAGVPDVMEVIDRDTWYHMDRRMIEIPIDNLQNNEDEIENTRTIVETMAEAVGLKIAFPLLDDFITRLMHGGLWRFGMTMQLIKMSLESAIYDDDSGGALKYTHFEKGYKRLTRCKNDISNVFISKEWHRIQRQVGRDGKLSTKYHLLPE